MTTLLQSVLRQLSSTGVEVGEDAALLRRFADGQDQAAFAVLVQRHGGLVWGVCRQMLPSESDAEDAFQATFLALVRSAGVAARAKAVGGWLHGVAVRVCLKARRTAARRRRREERAARTEAVILGELAWDDLHAAVHQEIEKLPATHRLALVLCDLQGVRQHDAAARLGWKVGTLTGRLARARQQLLKRLTARGLAPVVVAGVIGVGVTTAAAPVAVADKVLSLAAGGVVPSAVLTLTQSVLEGTLMKVKLLAAAVLTASAVTLGAGGWRGTADAQFPGPVGGPAGQPPGGAGQGRPGGPGMPGGGGPGMPGGGMSPAPMPRVEHALVDLPDSEKKLADLFTKRAADGWEFAGQVELGGTYQKLAFKRPAVAKGFGGPGMPGMGGSGVGGEGGLGGPLGLAPRSDPKKPAGPIAAAPGAKWTTFELKNIDATDVAKILSILFRGTDAQILAEESGKSLQIWAGPELSKEITAAVEKIDQIERPRKSGGR